MPRSRPEAGMGQPDIRRQQELILTTYGNNNKKTPLLSFLFTITPFIPFFLLSPPRKTKRFPTQSPKNTIARTTNPYRHRIKYMYR